MRPLQQRVTHISTNNRLYAAKRLTQAKRLVGKIVNNSKEARQLPHMQRVKRKDK